MGGRDPQLTRPAPEEGAGTLDRDGWSQVNCHYRCGRIAQLVIDFMPHRKSGGKYGRYCWQCYWRHEPWRLGPIVNCGPMWDGADQRRQKA